jgi:S1-C subfamily serine protease
MASVAVAQDALRILRRIQCSFSSGPNKLGSGFVWTRPGIVVTCAHVVEQDGASLTEILVDGRSSKLLEVHPDLDLAVIESPDTAICQLGDSRALDPGDELLFSGFPSGVRSPSVFSGIVSAIGERLIDYPKCRVIQINGMINVGNSGGPVFSSGGGVIGIVTAKSVPLLKEIDHLREILRTIPQFPSEVGIGSIDFSRFVNLTTQALLSVSSSLRLVQVGVGFAVPVHIFPRI